MKRIALIATAAVATMLTGCSTVATIAGDRSPKNFICQRGCRIPRVYSGVANDICFIRGMTEDSGLLIFDLPLSAAADTLVLPYTLVRQSKYGDLCTGLESNEAAQ